MDMQKYQTAIDEYIASDATLTCVAKKHHVHRYTLSSIMQERGIKIRPRGNIDSAIAYYRSGGTIDEAATLFHVSQSRLSKWLKDNREYRGSRIYNFDEHFFDSIDTELKAYWLGFICADGHVSSKYIRILLKHSDRLHLEKFAAIFGVPVRDGKSKDKRTNKTYYNSYIQLCSITMSGKLQSYGLDNRKSFTLDATVFGSVPQKLHRHFIRGYFDGDGCISRHYRDEFLFSIIGTEAFLLFVRNVLANNVGFNKLTLGRNGKLFTLAHGGNFQLIKLRNWLYEEATVWLERKKELWDQMTTRMAKGTSQYRGVSWAKDKGKWWARIMINRKVKHIGFYDNEIEAAEAYDSFVIATGLAKSKLNYFDPSVARR